ncbi:hypothetical protein GQX74_002379 [Glossina fuscipes]|nr:hypothetical protein GQX74_002379 [Glossina fuscipes]
MTLMRRIVVGITNTRRYNSVVAVIIVINKLNTSLQRRYGIMHNPNLFCMRMRLKSIYTAYAGVNCLRNLLHKSVYFSTHHSRSSIVDLLNFKALLGYLYSSSNALYSAVFSCFFFGLATGELS